MAIRASESPMATQSVMWMENMVMVMYSGFLQTQMAEAAIQGAHQEQKFHIHTPGAVCILMIYI